MSSSIDMKTNVDKTEKCFVCKQNTLLSESKYLICHNCKRIFPKSMDDVKSMVAEMAIFRKENMAYLRNLDDFLHDLDAGENSYPDALINQKREEDSLWMEFHSLHMEVDFCLKKCWSQEFQDEKFSHILYLYKEICQKNKEYYE